MRYFIIPNEVLKSPYKHSYSKCMKLHHIFQWCDEQVLKYMSTINKEITFTDGDGI